MDTVKRQSIERRILEVVDQYRSMILDPVEQEMGGSPSWKYLRGRLLKAFGERGIQGRIREVLDSEIGASGVQK